MTDIVEEDISHRLANRIEKSISLLETCGLDAKVTMTRDAALATADLLRAAKGMERSIQNLLDERTTYHAALSSRDREIAGLKEALRSCPCPGGGWNGMPADLEPTVGACQDHKTCGCVYGAALSTEQIAEEK